jgi:hypothetical protein
VPTLRQQGEEWVSGERHQERVSGGGESGPEGESDSGKFNTPWKTGVSGASTVELPTRPSFLTPLMLLPHSLWQAGRPACLFLAA